MEREAEVTEVEELEDLDLLFALCGLIVCGGQGSKS